MLKKKENLDLKILAYCIMDNHLHMIVFSEDIENVSTYMQRLNTAYALYYNTIKDRVGYVYRDRYYSEAILTERYLYNCIAYIHYNPVVAKIVNKPEEYKYSSYNDYEARGRTYCLIKKMLQIQGVHPYVCLACETRKECEFFMKIGNLEFYSIIENKNLVPKCIYDFVSNWSNEEKNNFLVAEINPEFADGNKLCEQYNIDKKKGFNCLVVECKRNDIIKYCALIVPIGYRYNMGSVVRKYTNSRVVSVAPLEYVIERTGMEYGSITPIGLPDDWMILVDPLIQEQEQIIIGGGYVKSKISVPTRVFLNLPNVEIVEGIAKKEEIK